MVISKQKLIETINTLSSYDREITGNDYITHHSLLLRKPITQEPKLFGCLENFFNIPQLNFNWIMNSDVGDDIKYYISYLREISDEYRKEFLSLKSNGLSGKSLRKYALKSDIADYLISTFHLFTCFDDEYLMLAKIRSDFNHYTMLALDFDGRDNVPFKIVFPDNVTSDEDVALCIEYVGKVLVKYGVKKYTLNIGKQQIPFVYNDITNEWESYEYGEQHV